MGEISRKSFLRGALSVAAGASLGPDLTGVASASPLTSDFRPSDRRPISWPDLEMPLPADVRVRGANVVPTARPNGDPWEKYGPNVWAAMWNVWDWAGWIRPQIDDAATVGNALRLWADTSVVSSGLLTRDVYLSRWQQLLDYVASMNLYVFACGGDLGPCTPADAVALYPPWIELLATYGNVLGVDVLNEAWNGGASFGFNYAEILALVRSLTDIVRGQGLPATASFPMATDAWWDWDGSARVFRDNPVAPFWEASDYLDIHVYSNTTPLQVAATHDFPWALGKPILFGEFGIRNNGTTFIERASYYEMVRQLVVSDNENIGALAWSTYDVNAGRNSCGLFSAPGVPRTDMTALLSTFPMSR